jgi:hypothetical protein
VQYHSQDIVPDPRQGQIHNPDRGATDREDHGSRHWRQGLLDCGCGWELLLCASGQARHQLQPESHYGQGQHLQLYLAGHLHILRRTGSEGDYRTRRPSSIVAASGPPQFVPAFQLEQSKLQLAALQSHVTQAVDEYKSAYPTQLKFDYVYKRTKRPSIFSRSITTTSSPTSRRTRRKSSASTK